MFNLALLLYFEKTTESDDYTKGVLVKQMMRAQNMRFSAMEILEGRSQYVETMESDIQEYDSALRAFTSGDVLDGKQLTPPTEEIHGYIAINNQLWNEYKSKAMLLANIEHDESALNLENGEKGSHIESGEEIHSNINNAELQEAFAYINDNTDDLIAISNQMRNAYLRLADQNWQLANQLTSIFVSITILTFGLAFLYTKKFIHPIKMLSATMNSVRNGQYETKANITSTDEIGSLAESFNSMIYAIQSRTNELNTKNKVLAETNERLTSLTTQLRNLTDKLCEVDIAKSEFTSMITHELKTPLVPIQGYCELLLDGTLGELTKEQKEKIQIVHESAISLAQLIQDVLDIHKLELGKMKFDMCGTSAKELIDRSISRFMPVAETKHIKLVDGIDEEIRLQCDPERILQVINNLVSNAVKFVPQNNGRIQIHARRDSGSVLFIVSDNGTGIPKEKQQNLFKKFYQADASLRRNAGGTGLGLAICKGIVEAHNGRIWVESEEGKGTTFYFSIPAGGQK